MLVIVTMERIYVKTEHFEGYASVQHTFNGEIYPVQIELEQPDENGQYIQRIKFDEIIKEKEADQHPQKYVARVSRYRMGYHIGDEYIIAQSKSGEYLNVHLMDGRMIGSYLQDFFEKIRPYEEPEIISHVVDPVLVIEKVVEPEKPISKEIEKVGQLDIFDFI